ncbi:hypothetical protein [Pseudochelatococcus sp. G4_1912]|uniref:hypothetical protein n=1 Tax=Pseudochelatococcus sp. G4_1912 TaxID=3114288 RepID=UPI0039C72BD8
MSKLDELRKHLKPGGVYRRENLAQWSTAVDRHIKELLVTEELVKLSAGLYLHPKQTAFGRAPADDAILVAAFLKDKRFLITSPNAYNALGVGATQLYNETVIYNHKRHGRLTLGSRSFDFRRRPCFPQKLTEEFLLVDLVNNLKKVAEDDQLLLWRVEKKAGQLNRKTLLQIANEFGTVRTRKFFDALVSNMAKAIS